MRGSQGGRAPRYTPVAEAAAPDGMAFIYVAHSEGYHKVGIADNLTRRLLTLATGNPFQIDMVHHVLVRKDQAEEVEGQCHRLLSQYHHRGEWFKADRDTVLNALEEAAPKAIIAIRGREEASYVARQKPTKRECRLSTLDNAPPVDDFWERLRTAREG